MCINVNEYFAYLIYLQNKSGNIHNHPKSLAPSAHPGLRKQSFSIDQNTWLTNAIENGMNSSSELREKMESEFKLRNDAKRTREISQEGQDGIDSEGTNEDVLLTEHDVRNFKNRLHYIQLNDKSEIEVTNYHRNP